MLKGRLAHKHPNISLGELFEQLCDLGLSAWDKSSLAAGSEISGESQIVSHAGNKPRSENTDRVTVQCTNGVTHAKVAASSKGASPTESAIPIHSAEPTKTAAPRNTLRKKDRSSKRPSQAQVVRDLFDKAGNRCENCHSTYALEVDHVVPKAKSGASDAENLRILCRSCNQRAAIQEFGLGKMETYLDRH